MTAVLPIQRDTGYNLHRTGDGSMPIIRCRLSCVRNSFLFSPMRLCNAMNPALRSSSSIEHFKLNLKKQHIRANPFNFFLIKMLYSRFIGKAAVNQTRIRLGLSALNFQRFQYNCVDNMSPHSQFAPSFSGTFRPQIKLRKDVSHPFHYYERRFAPSSYFGKKFRPLIRKTFRPLWS